MKLFLISIFLWSSPLLAAQLTLCDEGNNGKVWEYRKATATTWTTARQVETFNAFTSERAGKGKKFGAADIRDNVVYMLQTNPIQLVSFNLLTGETNNREFMQPDFQGAFDHLKLSSSLAVAKDTVVVFLHGKLGFFNLQSTQPIKIIEQKFKGAVRLLQNPKDPEHVIVADSQAGYTKLNTGTALEVPLADADRNFINENYGGSDVRKGSQYLYSYERTGDGFVVAHNGASFALGRPQRATWISKIRTEIQGGVQVDKGDGNVVLFHTIGNFMPVPGGRYYGAVFPEPEIAP